MSVNMLFCNSHFQLWDFIMSNSICTVYFVCISPPLTLSALNVPKNSWQIELHIYDIIVLHVQNLKSVFCMTMSNIDVICHYAGIFCLLICV